jgi:sigma-B regulation protein RsbU (phosphoserine phosphatase)
VAREANAGPRVPEPQDLARLNDLLFDDLDKANHFMSGCCATFDTVSRELSYANAGHPPALLLRADEAPVSHATPLRRKQAAVVTVC